jgi:quinol monooxygenase YgiN
MTTPTLSRPEEVTVRRNNRAADGSPTILDTSARVTVVSSFIVSPSRALLWEETWQKLAQVALSRPECRGFRIFRGHGQDAHFIVFSDWGSGAHYHRFVRETSLVWLDRVMPGLTIPSELNVLETVSVASSRAP